MDPADDDPQDNQPMEEGAGVADDSDPEDGSDSDNGGDTGSSDEELPEFEIPAGGGEVMLVLPQNIVNPALDVADNDLEMYIDETHNPLHTYDDAKLEIIWKSVCPYLSFKDMKISRLISPRFNMLLINKLDALSKRSKGRYSTAFYKDSTSTNSQISMKLNHAVFQNFLFFRKHDFFKSHWQLTATNLETIELDNCSLECEGLKFLVDFAPVLNKLIIRNSKLRDVDNFHEHPRKTEVTRAPIPKYNGIKILHLEGIKIIENCFTQYLIEKIKPNTLTEVSLTNCFMDEISKTLVDKEATTSAAEYFRHFVPLFTKLILKNTKSLKKMSFKGNPFQMQILQRLTGNSEVLNLLEPTHLSLALHRPVVEELYWNPLFQFLRDRCSKLEHLNLKIIHEEEVQHVRNIIETLTLIQCPLQSFNFEFNGNSKAEKIELGGLMNNFTELTQLIVSDIKPLDPDVRYIVGGERFWRYRLHSCFGYTPAHSDYLVRQSITNVPPVFLAQMPPKISKLSIKRFMPETNIWLECFQNPACLQSFMNLTKLEICGPYIHSMHLAIPQILTLKNLESLALPNCDIQDTYITGLGWEAIMDLRRCLTTVFCVNGPGRTREDLDRAISEAPNYVSRTQILSAPRSKISDLPKLKYLDLSNNPQISDVGIYDSMRLPLVEHLVLKNCPRITDNGISMIGMNFPSLRVLNIKHCRKMSKFGLNELIKMSRNLKRIHTTKVVANTHIDGFKYDLSPLFEEIVCTSYETDTGGFFICEEMSEA